MQKRTTFVLSLLLSMTAQGLLQPLLFSQEQAIAPSRELSLNRTWGNKHLRVRQQRRCRRTDWCLFMKAHRVTPKRTALRLEA